MYETIGPDWLSPRGATVILGLVLGALFGVLAQRSRFCLRRAVAGRAEERGAAGATWLAAAGVAILGTQAAVALGWIDFAGHRLAPAALPALALVAGGLMFGAGMVLARGCLSRLAVLGAGGNPRALTVLGVAAVTAHATMKGVLAPLRTALSAPRIEPGLAMLGDLPGGALWGVALAALALGAALRLGARPGWLAMGAAIGLLVPAGWIGTGYLLQDAFDPVAVESLSFTGPATDSLFWVIAASAVAPNFGVGLIGGVLAGAFLAALAAREAAWRGFEGAGQMGRALAGGAMMGVGGVLAGGCTVGAGLSGVPTLGLAPILALAAIVAGARLALSVPRFAGFAGSAARRPARPAA
jgi:uncharacterized membrane protein YedE/YeeE